MTADHEEPTAKVPGQGRIDGMIERLVERIGGKASASTVFGEPVERDGVTVIPVARVRYGFGGGGGSGHDALKSADGEGSGAGGGLSAAPVGYIEITGGEAVYRRIFDPAGLWPSILAGAFAVWLVLRGIRTLRRK